MLSSDHKPPKEEIPQLLRRGIHVRSEYIELIYRTTNTDPRLRGDDNKKPRFAFIVSTKVDKRATQRNRMRRVMSESVRHLVSTLPPMDGIFIAKKNFAGLPQSEVEKIISGLLAI